MAITRVHCSSQYFSTKTYNGHVFPLFQMDIQVLVNKTSKKLFPLCPNVIYTLETLKTDIADSVVTAVADDIYICIETDASDSIITATLTQSGCPVSFIFCTLYTSEQRHSAVEK